MPRLPSADGVRPTPTPGRSVVGYDGTGVSRAVQGLGQTLEKVSDEYDREIDAQAVFAARRQLDDWERKAIFDPKEGAIRKQGADAFGIGTGLATSFDEVSGKISEGLRSNRQRRAFAEMSASRRSQVLDWASKHEIQQRERYDANQYEADIQSFADRAALFPDKAAAELDLQRQRTIGFMRGKGASTEEIDAKVKADASKAHGVVIASMLNAGNGEAARSYFDKNRGDMTAEVQLRAESALKETNARTRAQSFGDDAMARGLTAEQAIREAREKFTGADEDAAVLEVKLRFTEADALRARDQKQASDEAWKVLTNGGGRKGIRPELWTRLGGEEQRQIGDWLEAKWRREKADAEEKSAGNWGAFMALTDMARDNPDRFMDPQTLLKNEPYLSKQQMATLVTLRTGLSKQDAKAANLLTQMKDAESMVLADMKSAGLDTSPKEGSKQADDLRDFRGLLQQRIASAQAETGRALNPQELRTIGMSLVREGYEQGSGIFGFFQSKKRGFEMDPAKTYIVKRYDEIPSDVRKQLEAELPKGMYGGVDKAQVERMYQRAVELGRIKP